MSDNTVFVDIETTGLDIRAHKVWQIGMVSEDGNTLLDATLSVDLTHAQVEALAINNYVEVVSERVENPAAFESEWIWVWSQIERITKDKVLAGATVHFDEKFLEKMSFEVDKHFQRDPTYDGKRPWHYKILDVTTYAAGVLGKPSGIMSLSAAAEQLDVSVDPTKLHSALYDADLARRVFLTAQDHALGRIPYVPMPTVTGSGTLTTSEDD